MVHIKSCKVKLLNRIYEVKCPEGEEINLSLAADMLHERMQLNQNKFKKLDNYEVLLLAALHLSHELILCRKEQERQRLQVTQFISSLDSKTGKTLSSHFDQLPETD